jgi:hypothetical protein
MPFIYWLTQIPLCVRVACIQFQAQSRYNLEEAEWLHRNHKPSFKDKLHLSAMSTGVTALCVYTMVCMGEAMPKGALEWALGCPDVVMACAKIGRLLNDLAGSAEVRTHICNVLPPFRNIRFFSFVKKMYLDIF